MGIALAVMCLAIAAPASAAEAGNVAAKGCGGFVKSQKNIDFSTIEIVMETQTQSGKKIFKKQLAACLTIDIYILRETDTKNRLEESRHN